MQFGYDTQALVVYPLFNAIIQMVTVNLPKNGRNQGLICLFATSTYALLQYFTFFLPDTLMFKALERMFHARVHI